jgi:hypothetical protein
MEKNAIAFALNLIFFTLTLTLKLLCKDVLKSVKYLVFLELLFRFGDGNVNLLSLSYLCKDVIQKKKYSLSLTRNPSVLMLDNYEIFNCKELFLTYIFSFFVSFQVCTLLLPSNCVVHH